MSADPHSTPGFPPPPESLSPRLAASAEPADERYPDEEPQVEFDWKLNAALFVLTVLSVFFTGTLYTAPPKPDEGLLTVLTRLHEGWPFAVPLLAILLAHEFGHYIAARLHGVPASLPYFIPLPLLSPFGTMGAVIAMRGKIGSRNALLDIGAAGPLAGMVVALPVIAIGLSISPVGDPPGPAYQEGASLLYAVLKRIFVGVIPEGQDVLLGPTAFAGWAGFLVTMINLLPWGQLDGGHIAYALFGERQNRFARWVRAALLPLFLFNVALFFVPIALGKVRPDYWQAGTNSMFWLVWFLVLGLLGRLSRGANHPPTEPGELSPGRRAIAWFSLALFVLLFMPTPMALYD
jgi:membrane-associated protease RseP (regulator of RpoE activity)